MAHGPSGVSRISSSRDRPTDRSFPLHFSLYMHMILHPDAWIGDMRMRRPNLRCTGAESMEYHSVEVKGGRKRDHKQLSCVVGAFLTNSHALVARRRLFPNNALSFTTHPIQLQQRQ